MKAKLMTAVPALVILLLLKVLLEIFKLRLPLTLGYHTRHGVVVGRQENELSGLLRLQCRL